MLRIGWKLPPSCYYGMALVTVHTGQLITSNMVWKALEKKWFSSISLCYAFFCASSPMVVFNYAYVCLNACCRQIVVTFVNVRLR